MNVESEIILARLQSDHNAASRKELMGLAGCSGRVVRSTISDLRRAGWLIVGNASGYCIAHNFEEVCQVLMDLESHIHSLQDVVMAMRVAAMVRFGEEKPRWSTVSVIEVSTTDGERNG